MCLRHWDKKGQDLQKESESTKLHVFPLGIQVANEATVVDFSLMFLFYYFIQKAGVRRSASWPSDSSGSWPEEQETNGDLLAVYFRTKKKKKRDGWRRAKQTNPTISGQTEWRGRGQRRYTLQWWRWFLAAVLRHASGELLPGPTDYDWRAQIVALEFASGACYLVEPHLDWGDSILPDTSLMIHASAAFPSPRSPYPLLPLVLIKV